MGRRVSAADDDAAEYSGALLDTSVWVAVLEGEPSADSLGDAQGSLETVTTPVVLAELASLHRRGRTGGESPVDVVLSASRVEEFFVEDALEGGALHGRLRDEGHRTVGLGDCLIYATARRVGALLITLDQDLAREPHVKVLKHPKSSERAKRSR